MTDILKDAFDKYLDTLDNEEELKCECGAKHTSFPKYHYFWCPMFALEGS